MKWIFHKRGEAVAGIWLTAEQKYVLKALFNGAALRSHRDLEGNKCYLLHTSEREKVNIGRKSILNLRKKRLLETNHKFPSATFLLTSQGNTVAAQLSDGTGSNPLTARGFIRPK